MQNIPNEPRDSLARELNVADTGGTEAPLIAELLQQKGSGPKTPTHVGVVMGFKVLKYRCEL